MSYDIEVFSTERPTLASMPAGRDWQIVADGPLNVESEDIPAHVRPALPGIRFLTRFHLEGAAPDSALKKLLTLARALAREARGVVVDQQAGTTETPRGVQRLTTRAEWRGGPLLQLSWFVHTLDPLVQAAPATLLDMFEQTIPELLPRRYGLFEPPQFTLSVEGRPHFQAFLKEHLRDSIVWSCSKPCRYVFVSVPEHVGATPRGFRCGRLTIDINGGAATDRAWRVELMRLWVSVADLLHAFYAEIRLGECPTKSWWWNGIPSAGASAVLIADPYDDLWPSFAQGAHRSPGGRPYRERWTDVEPAIGDAQLPTPPATIAQPSDWRRESDLSTGGLLSALRQNNIPYPDVWPFEGPFSKIGA